MPHVACVMLLLPTVYYGDTLAKRASWYFLSHGREKDHEERKKTILLNYSLKLVLLIKREI